MFHYHHTARSQNIQRIPQRKRVSTWMKSSTQTQLLGLHTPSPDVGDGHGVKMCNHAGCEWLDSMRTPLVAFITTEKARARGRR